MAQTLNVPYSRETFFSFLGHRSTNSEETGRKALKHLDNYLASLGETENKLMPKLLEMKGTDDFYVFLNGFVQYMSKSLHPNSVEVYFALIKSYFRKRGFKIHNEDIKQFIDFPKAIKEGRAPVTHKEIGQLVGCASPYMKMVILWLTSSGMRISEFLQLQKDDVNFKSDPVEIKIRGEITKTKTDRVTFISKQAAKIRTPELFKESYSKQSLINIEKAFAKLRTKSGLDSKYRTSNVHHITLHTFRSFFRTQAGLINRDFAEDVLGHEGYLSQYIRLSMEQKRAFYKQLESTLFIEETKSKTKRKRQTSPPV